MKNHENRPGIFLSFTDLLKGSDDFSLQTDTQTLHHNIYIIMIIMIILVDKILFPFSMIFMMVVFHKLYTIHALVVTPKKSSIVNAFRAIP